MAYEAPNIWYTQDNNLSNAISALNQLANEFFVGERRRKEVKKDLVDTILLERQKSSPDTTVIDEAQYKARAVLGTRITGDDVRRERLAKRKGPLERRLPSAPRALRKRYRGYQRRYRERFGQR